MAGLKGRDAEGLPSGDEKVRIVRSMFDSIAPRYDFVNRAMTFGLDVRWRAQTIADLGLENGALIFDVACGTGDFCRMLRKSRYRAVGFDNSAGMLAAARTTAPLVLADALRLPVAEGAADGVTCGFALRNVTDLKDLFNEFARVLRPGGRIALLEVAEPNARVLRLVHGFYFQKMVPVIGGLLSDRQAYSYLPKSYAYLPTPEVLISMIEAAGFNSVHRKVLGLGAAQLITGTRE